MYTNIPKLLLICFSLRLLINCQHNKTILEYVLKHGAGETENHQQVLKKTGGKKKSQTLFQKCSLKKSGTFQVCKFVMLTFYILKTII